MRTWINLPHVPPELFDQAREEDDLEIVMARRRMLFSYFGAYTDTKEEPEKLAFSLAAAVFPAFRSGREHYSPKPRGRPPAARPKHEVDFLEKLARDYDRKKREIKSKSTTSTKRVYEIFLKENPDFANKLQVRGKPLELGSFSKLLSVGRSARNNYVMWRKDALSALPGNAKKIRRIRNHASGWKRNSIRHCPVPRGLKTGVFYDSCQGMTLVVDWLPLADSTR